MEKNDQELVVDCLNGDGGAMPELISRYLKSVYNFVYGFVGNAGDAEDITQEVFVKAWKNLKKYEQEKSFKAWIFAIARNAAIDWLRKKKDIVFSDFEDEEGKNELTDSLAGPEPLPDELMALAENKKLLNSLINKLPVIYKEVLTLRYSDDFTFEEIGKILSRSADTVKSRHRRALVALKKLLENAPK